MFVLKNTLKQNRISKVLSETTQNMTDCCKSDYKSFLGFLALIWGVVILLELFDVIPEGTGNYVTPALLVVGGLYLMFHDENSCSTPEPKSKPAPKKSKKKRRVVKK